MVLTYIATASLGYLLGSIPFAVLVAKHYGIDILKVGSGSAGATNVKRVVGKRAGNIVFALDFGKGILAAAWPILFFTVPSKLFTLQALSLAAAVVGHSFSCFLKFKGGKSIAVTMGGLLILLPSALLIGVILWTVVFYTTRYVSLASIVFASSLPITTGLMYSQGPMRYLALAIALFIIYKHKSNIIRLIQGSESRFQR